MPFLVVPRIPSLVRARQIQSRYVAPSHRPTRSRSVPRDAHIERVPGQGTVSLILGVIALIHMFLEGRRLLNLSSSLLQSGEAPHTKKKKKTLDSLHRSRRQRRWCHLPQLRQTCKAKHNTALFPPIVQHLSQIIDVRSPPVTAVSMNSSVCSGWVSHMSTLRISTVLNKLADDVY